MERVAAIDARTMCEKLGKPPEEWPPIPTLRGMSRSTGALVISATLRTSSGGSGFDAPVCDAEVDIPYFVKNPTRRRS
jgi:hypothetical protein